MKVYDRSGNEHNLTEYDGSFSYFGIIKLINIEDVDEFSINGTVNGYGIGMGLIDSEAYLSFYIGWVCMQFKVTNGGQGYFTRYKYGNSAWSDWLRIS